MSNKIVIAMLLYITSVATVAHCVVLAARGDRYNRTVKYDGEILVRCPVNVPSIKSFLELKEHVIDVWRITPDGEADIRMPEDVFESPGLGLDKECVKIADIESLVQESEKRMFTSKRAEWFEEYHRYDEIIEWYQDLANRYSQLIKIESIGESLEGRDQPAVRITGNTDSRNINKIYFQCQIHAREWISGATCMYIANYLAEGYDNDNLIRDILNQLEFVIVPFVNPDGYEYTWTNNRLWRKNRQPNSDPNCFGVDLNRNYNANWGGAGSSNNPCSETYHGASVTSEPEVKNTVEFFKSLGNVVGSIDWHSYSQLILRPYGYTSEDSLHESQMSSIGARMSAEIFNVHGMTYTSQKGIQLYTTSGTARDWFYSEDANENNGEYRSAGYTLELRDTGRYGFELPADQIIPQGEEIVPAVLFFAEQLNSNPLSK